jgi:hypothetical protein
MLLRVVVITEALGAEAVYRFAFVLSTTVRVNLLELLGTKLYNQRPCAVDDASTSTLMLNAPTKPELSPKW